MKVKLEQGRLSINIHELVESLTQEEKSQLADTLACDDEIIKNVADQITNGWTTAGSHAARDSDAPEPCYPLGKAIRAASLASGDIAKRHIEELVATLKRTKAWGDQTQKWAFGMYHKMNDAGMKTEMWPPIYEAKPDEYEVVKKEMTIAAWERHWAERER